MSLTTIDRDMTSFPAGPVLPFAGSAAPTGWLLCDGAAVSRTTYAKLFGVISTTFGAGNGTTTFNLPDTRGEFIRGLDGGRGVDTGRTLGSAQAANVANHKHELPLAFATNTGDVMFKSLTPEFGQSSTTWSSSNVNGGGTATVRTGQANAFSSDPVSTTVSGETRPRNVAMNMIIKF